jgi:hypothetical protein
MCGFLSAVLSAVFHVPCFICPSKSPALFYIFLQTANHSSSLLEVRIFPLSSEPRSDIIVDPPSTSRMTRSTSSSLHLSFFSPSILFIFAVIIHHALSFTNEPPGRDPVSIDQVRGAERAVSLTSDNFDELTKGKLVFIKFYSP